MEPTNIIRTEKELIELYGTGSKGSLAKEVDYIHPHYRDMIEASSFVIIASAGDGRLDVSPRGDPAGFVAIEDERTLLIPDRRGNNRVDTLRNLIIDPRIALLFLISGINESLRVNGTAAISVAADLLERFTIDGKPPRSVVVIDVHRVYFQCPRAAVRAGLWNPEKFLARSALASNGTLLADLSGDQTYRERDATREQVVRSTLY